MGGGYGSLQEIDQENQGFKNWSGHQPSPVSAVGSYGTIYVYFDSLTEFQTHARTQVENLFQGVTTADSESGANTDKLLIRTEYCQNMLTLFLDGVRPTDGSANYYDPEIMIQNLQQMDTNLRDILADRLAYVDKNGNVTFDWKKIEDLFGTDLNDVQRYEIDALVIAIGRTTTYKDGAVTTDWEAYRKFLEYGTQLSDTDITRLPSEYLDGHYRLTATYKLTPTAESVFSRYQQGASELIYIGAPLLYRSGLTNEEQIAADALKQEALKLSIMTDFVANSTRTEYSFYKTSQEAKIAKAEMSPHLGVQLTEEFDGKYSQFKLTVGSQDPAYQSVPPYESTVLSFEKTFKYSLDDVTISLLDSLYRDKDAELLEYDKAFAANIGLDFAGGTLGHIPVVGSVINSLSILTKSDYLAERDALAERIDLQNDSYDNIKRNMEMAKTSDAMTAGGLLTLSSDGTVKDAQIIFNDAELEIRARAFAKANPNYKDVTASDLKLALAKKDSSLLTDYVDWWKDQERGGTDYADYKDELVEEYKKSSEFDDKRFGSLTPSEIIELDKKLKDGTS